MKPLSPKKMSMTSLSAEAKNSCWERARAYKEKRACNSHSDSIDGELKCY